MVKNKAVKAALTVREREVLVLVALGKSARVIGEDLHITKRTVYEHIRTASRKVGALNRTHAIAIALRDGMIKI